MSSRRTTSGRPIDQMAQLLRRGSVFGRFGADVRVCDGSIEIDGRPIRFLAEPDPKAVPWDDLGVDVVLDATGRFRDRTAAAAHIEAGASRGRVRPVRGRRRHVRRGVNDDTFDPAIHLVVSNASCTTNYLADGQGPR
jgi:glyceraldehyde 3-phosphate dehydrogenase